MMSLQVIQLEVNVIALCGATELPYLAPLSKLLRLMAATLYLKKIRLANLKPNLFPRCTEWVI